MQWPKRKGTNNDIHYTEDRAKEGSAVPAPLVVLLLNDTNIIPYGNMLVTTIRK